MVRPTLNFIRRRVSSFAVLAILFLATTSNTIGATENTNAIVEEVLVEGKTISSVLNLNESSTAGSRLGLTPLETPASVAVVDGDLVRSIGSASALEAKSLAVGIGTSNSPGCGGNTVSGRGFYGANSVKQLYDGMEIYNAGCVVSFPVDTWNVERIEVLKGPASVLYGSGAIGGAINVIPKRPTPESSGTEVLFSYGSFDTYQSALGSTDALTDRLSYRADISRRTSEGWVDRGESDSTAVSIALRYDVNDNLRFTLSNDYGDQNPSSYLGTPLGTDGKPVERLRDENYNIADAEVFFTDNRTNLLTEWNITPYITLKNNTYSMWHDRGYHDVYIFSYDEEMDTITRSRYRDIDDTFERQHGDTGHIHFSEELFNGRNSLLIGWDINRIYYHRNDTVRGGSTTVDATDFNPGFYSDDYSNYAIPFYRMHVDQFGLFAEDNLKLRDNLSLVTGIRLDRYEVERYDNRADNTTNSDYDALGGNLGIVFNPTENSALYAQYAVASDPVNSFASISASQQSFHLSDGSQIEAGFKQSFLQSQGKWTISIYDLVKEDLLTTSLVDPTLTEQVGQQSSQGVETSFSLALGKWLINANATVLNAEYDNFSASVGGSVTSLAGNVPTNVPEEAANLMLFWHPYSDWQLRAIYQYIGETYANSTNTSVIGDRSIVNFGVAWQASDKTKLDLRMDNVFDEIYPTWGSTTQWMLGTPRSIHLSVHLQL